MAGIWPLARLAPLEWKKAQALGLHGAARYANL